MDANYDGVFGLVNDFLLSTAAPLSGVAFISCEWNSILA